MKLIINDKTYTDNSAEADKNSIFVVSKHNEKYIQNAKENGCIEFLNSSELKNHLIYNMYLKYTYNDVFAIYLLFRILFKLFFFERISKHFSLNEKILIKLFFNLIFRIKKQFPNESSF